MPQSERAFAIGAHPDDIEFNMAGTLSLLAQAGFEPHMMNISWSNLDSNELSPEETASMRVHEARHAAQVINAVYHEPFAYDLLILYEETLLRRMLAVIRDVQPTIVLLPSLNDYMEDHTNAARLVVTACFSRAMRHFISNPPRKATDQDLYLYHAQPHLNRDGMREFVVPNLMVNISNEMDTKLKMLACHESQREWLGETQGLDDYLESMRRAGLELAKRLRTQEWTYAEGFRQHSHVGFSRHDHDLLAEVLGNQVVSRAAFGEEAGR
ncbi:MAG: PIG-L deacetylase family protein [Planctomycetota bacterium]